ncbi:RE1 [Symbiodinium sp. CCMP2456]|nr:RE1 [Symbiodinium sp. CCMP2456]
MTVTDAAESLVSVHSLVARGHKVVFSPGGCYLETRAGDTVPLELHGKRWYLKVMDKTEGPKPARGRIAPVGDELDLGPKEPDRWKREVKDGVEYLIREHNNARKRLFAPKVKDLPVPLDRIESGRLTKMIFEEDGSRREDRSMWEDRRYAMRDMGHAWLGETWFRLKPERAEDAAPDEEQPSHEDEWMRGLDEAYEKEVLEGEEAHEQIVEDEEDADDRLVVDEGDDDRKAKTIKAPKEPTAAEVEEHSLHHANFESWCPVCVMGQGKSKQHRRIKEEPKEHIIYSDYMFFSKEGAEVSKEKGEKKKKTGLVTVLTAICKDSQYPFALALPSKASVDYASKALTSWVKDLKWDKVVIQFDQESALNKIYEKVKAGMGDTITLRRSPRYSSQSLADGEMVNGLIAGKVRTWLAEVSEKCKTKIGCDSVLFPWIVRHSAWTLARFHINHSKTTAFRIVNGYDYLGEMMAFGQVAMAKYPKQKDKAVLEKARGVPWNRYLGIATTRVAQEKSEQKAVSVPELEAAETYDFGSGEQKEVLVVPMPVPLQGEKHEKAMSEGPESKRARVEPADAKQPAGDTAQASSGPLQFNIGSPDASMGTGSLDMSLYSPSLPGDNAQDMVSCISNHGEWSEASKCLGKEDYKSYQEWLKRNKGCFDANMVSNIMDYLDTMQMDERELKRSRKEELRKLNEVYGAFTPRDGRQLSRDLTVFGHKWVDKVTEGVAKSRLTCQDFKKKQDANERKLLEVYSLATRMPRVTADLSSAFLIAKDGGDAKGQPVMMRQSAAAQYRDRLEVILTKELPKGVYEFHRGKLDACVFRCKRTGIVLIHHIDDFDVCGPAALLDDLLKVQLPKCGCKLKVGELEWPGEASSSTSEFLGRKKILVEDAVVTLPNEKHISDILRMLGLEQAKSSPVPGKKLNLQDNKLLEGKAKEVYASCVGSATYLSQDRPDIKFACKELAKRIREPRECDMQNLKVLGRYLRGTMHVGHVTKLDEQLNPVAGIPLQGFCDSDWAGDKEDRKSTSGQVIVLGGTVVDLVFVRNLGVEDFGMSIDVPRLFCDSSAAIQVARRLGVGKMRHVDLGHLYIQELVKEKRVIVQKIKGTENPSNALTKHLATGAETEEARGMLGLVTLDKQGLDKHVSKNTMQSVGALTGWRKWQPQQCTRLSTKQFVSAVGDCVHGYNVPTWKALYEQEGTQSPLRPWVSRFVQS